MIRLSDYVNSSSAISTNLYRSFIVPPLWRMSAVEEDLFYGHYWKNRSANYRANLLV